MKPTLARRKRASGIAPAITRSGGPLGIIVMATTVACLLLLVFIQGSYFWSSASTAAAASSGSDSVSLHQHAKGKGLWDQQRDAFLETLRQDGHQNLCGYLQPDNSQQRTARKLWVQYIGAILAASQHPDDPQFLHEDWTKRLLAELPPSLLQQTLDQPPLPPQQQQPPASSKLRSGESNNNNNNSSESWPRLLEIIRRKLRDPVHAPPLRVAVLGGTFAEGEGCAVASVGVPDGSIMANPSYCAWPYRLQAFLHKLLGGIEWIQIVNLAEEGTDTGFMTPLLKNWMYPAALLPEGPDVIINAYGKHDYTNYGEAPPPDLHNTIHSEMASFLRSVQTSHPCGTPPVVVHLDDVGVDLSAEPGVLFASRPSGPFRKATAADGQRQQLAMAGHMAVTWTLAFGALEGALRHCGTASRAIVPLPAGPEPDCQDPSTGEPSCAFAFLAGPQGTVKKVTEFQKYIRPFTQSNAGWQVLSDMSTGWSRKTGLVAVAPNASILFSIKDIDRPVRYFHLMTLKSSADPWREGKAMFRVAILPPNHGKPMETSFVVDGKHDGKEQHITHHFDVDFDTHQAPVGSDVMLSVELIEGTTFKVLGLMLCS